MRYDTLHDRLHDKPQLQPYEKALTLADLCQAIEERRLPVSRQSNDYVVRRTDARWLWAEIAGHHDDRLEAPPQPETLDVGRSA